MRMKSLKYIVPFLVLLLFASIVPGCQPQEPVESYLAVLPQILRSDSTQIVSLSLFAGEKPTSGEVEIALLKEGETIAKAKKRVEGKGSIELDIPKIEAGDYEVSIKGAGFEDRAPIKVEKSCLVFAETDKPIYKPGQTMHLRLVTLDVELKPSSELSTVEILDSKGIKLFRKELETDEFGMATLDFPISEEPNLGVWKLIATTAKAKSQLDVRVEEYVLPKYEVKVELPKEWFLVNEPIEGTVTAEYSFGKPVNGELEIKASRYVGEWEEYATLTKTIDGETEFSIPAVGYVAGTPASGGMGNVMLEVTLKEKSTGYEEKTSELLTVAEAPVNLKFIPEGIVYKPGLPFSILVVSETPDNKPVETEVELTLTYLDDELEKKEQEKKLKTINGKALLEITPPNDSVALIIEGSAGGAQALSLIHI